MILLHNYRILKGVQDQGGILYDGDDALQTFELSDFTVEKKPEPQEEQNEVIEKGIPPEEALLQDAVWKAEALLERAREEGEQIRQEAYDDGFKLGKEEGREVGRLEAREEEAKLLAENVRNLEETIGQYVADMEIEKEKVLEQYLDDLKNIALAIGEKIVQTSLKSSGEVVKRMIIAATEKLKKTAWAKIYIAKTHEEMDIQGDHQLLKELAKLSDNVKIVIMEDAEPGTCIIELPQEIIDISTSAQMENIRDILNNARV